MAEEKVKKRGWVKNAAIIFLAVMLVLTFFSNTIMNHSLPEVAAQYAQSGTISATIRGTGTIEAVESYTAKSSQTRTVLSVPVKLGDEVSVGDTLLVYGEADSDELKSAQDTLDDLVLSYQKALINSCSGQYSSEKAAITDAQDALDAAKAKRDANAVSDADIAAADVKVAQCQAALTSAEAALDAFGDPVSPSSGDYSAVTAASNTLAAKKLLYKDELAAFDATVAAERGTTSETVYKEYLADKYSSYAEDTDEYGQYIAYTAVKAAQEAYNDALADYNANTTSGNLTQYNKLKAAVTAADGDLTAAKSAQDSLLTKKSAYDDAVSEVSACQKTLQDALLTLQKDTALENLDLSSMQKQISDQNDVISGLKGDGESSTVTSQVNGVVTAINVSAGDTAQADSDLVVVEVPDRGYKVSFSVTKEQSQKVSVGDEGQILYNYWSDPITARLSVIRTDPENPTTNKILDFTISGDDIDSGSQVTISIGERSSNYDVVIPNSAIRSDANGKFVLAVVTKNSPLSNRYIATRVDVQVLASDDVNSAVSGALLAGDFVITTSTKPVEAGTQVRLADQVTE